MEYLNTQVDVQAHSQCLVSSLWALLSDLSKGTNASWQNSLILSESGAAHAAVVGSHLTYHLALYNGLNPIPLSAFS